VKSPSRGASAPFTNAEWPTG